MKFDKKNEEKTLNQRHQRKKTKVNILCIVICRIFLYFKNIFRKRKRMAIQKIIQKQKDGFKNIINKLVLLLLFVNFSFIK